MTLVARISVYTTSVSTAHYSMNLLRLALRERVIANLLLFLMTLVTRTSVMVRVAESQFISSNGRGPISGTNPSFNLFNLPSDDEHLLKAMNLQRLAQLPGWLPAPGDYRPVYRLLQAAELFPAHLAVWPVAMSL